MFRLIEGKKPMFKVRYFYRGDNKAYTLNFLLYDNALNACGHVIDDERVAAVMMVGPDNLIKFGFIE